MYTVFLAGGIASGKSTVARLLEGHGARRLDLDRTSREVLRAGSACTLEVAEAFGADLLDAATGELDRGLLARRAFSSAEGTARLESIELPHIKEALLAELAREGKGEPWAGPCVVVEVPLLDLMEDLLDRADEVVCVTCPLELRAERAQGRGMAPDDFWARVARQPDDDYLRSHATCVIENDGSPEALVQAVEAWWQAREASRWAGSRA